MIACDIRPLGEPATSSHGALTTSLRSKMCDHRLKGAVAALDGAGNPDAAARNARAPQEIRAAARPAGRPNGSIGFWAMETDGKSTRCPIDRR